MCIYALSTTHERDVLRPLVHVPPHEVGQVDLGDLDVGVGAADDVRLLLGADGGRRAWGGGHGAALG